MSANTQAARAAESLRRDICSAYERLRARGELTGTVHGMSIDAAVSPLLAPGLTLRAAEDLLRSAGFDLVPVRSKAGAVYASSDTVLPNSSLGVRNEVVIVLTPSGSGPATVVGAVDARIIVTTL